MQCPHCLQYFHESWNYNPLVDAAKNNYVHDKDGYWGTGSTICAACGRVVVMFGQFSRGAVTRAGEQLFSPHSLILIYPRGISRSPIPPEVPPEFATDYSEACLVLPDSEKASAALSRRCLQYLLHKKAGVKQGNLAQEIQQVLDSKQLPGHLADDLDAVRHIGNFAAHPMKATNTGEIMDVLPQEAEWSLNVLEGLFDFYFVQPARAKAKRDALNAKLQGAGKPPMKKP